MNTPARIGYVLLCVGTTLLSPSAIGQGGLTPPGAPAPTMQTLDQIGAKSDQLNAKADVIEAKSEKRIPIGATTTPGDANNEFIISQPGSYYLTGNVDVTLTNGIRIAAGGVTLDLNGFAIRRASGSGGSGIAGDGRADHCVIRNGSIGSFTPSAPAFAYGVNVTGDGGTLQHISVAGCSDTAVVVTGIGWHLEDCKAHNNSGSGIHAGNAAVLNNCVAANNGTGIGLRAGAASTLTNCTAYGQVSGIGILADTASALTNCVARDNGGTGIVVNPNCVLTNCSSVSNDGEGITGEDGITLQNCSAGKNGGWGINVDDSCTLTNCVADGNFSTGSTLYGISVGVRSLVSKCVASNNRTSAATPTATSGGGINAGSGSTVRDCLVSGNMGDGIRLAEFGEVLNNTANENGTGTGDGAGIHILGQRCRVEGNHVTGNERGVEVSAVRNLIVRNSARSNGSNYVIVAGNRTAQIVVPAVNAADIAHANNGSSDGFTAVDPWANFSF